MPTAEELRAATQEVAGHLRSSMLVMMIELGHRLGLLEAMAGAGPLTPRALAERAGCDERNVLEWLGAMATGGLVTLDAGADTYALDEAHAAVLTGGGPSDLSRLAAQPTVLAAVVPAVAEAMRTGVGVGYDAYAGFGALMDQMSRPLFDAVLVSGYLATVDGLVDRLTGGGLRCLDVGCGTGHASIVLGRAFPGALAAGLDLSDEAVAAGRATAMAEGLANVELSVGDALALPTDPPWDLITAFDAIHDQADPMGLLRRIHSALAPAGVFLMVDIKAGTGVAANLGHPMGPWFYGVSVLHCLQVSLAGGGPGLGTCWGRELAESMLRDAGFGSVDVHKVEADRANLVYVCRP
jgi:SAM-dependent methyltransferase